MCTKAIKITRGEYRNTIAVLRRGFHESLEVINMLENVVIVDEHITEAKIANDDTKDHS
jgi:hypothetical protein